MSEQQAAAYLSLSTGVFSEHFKSKLKRLEFGRSVRYNRKDLDRMVDAKANDDLTDEAIKKAALEGL